MNKLQSYKQIFKGENMVAPEGWTYYIFIVGGNNKALKVERKPPGNYVVMELRGDGITW